MNDDLHFYIEKLERENEMLKKELLTIKRDSYGWSSIKNLIGKELEDLEKYRSPYGSFIYKTEQAINKIVRQTLNLKFIRDVNYSNYDAAEEITKCILEVMKKYFKYK